MKNEGAIMKNLEWLQEWYENNCNGIWEHTYGVEIGTLDNPGWFMKADLAETCLADKDMAPISEAVHDSSWIECWVENNVFYGNGDAKKIDKIIDIFRKWAEEVKSQN